MDEKASREAFEKWLEEKCLQLHPDCCLKMANGEYGGTWSQSNWEAWQAAIAFAESKSVAPKGFDAKFLSCRLERVARLTGTHFPDDMTHEQIAEVAGTILGSIAGNLEREKSQPAAPIAEQAVPESKKLAEILLSIIPPLMREKHGRDFFQGEGQDEHRAEVKGFNTCRAEVSDLANKAWQNYASQPPMSAQQAPTVPDRLRELLNELRVILQMGTPSIDVIHEHGADCEIQRAWQLFHDDIMPILAASPPPQEANAAPPVKHSDAYHMEIWKKRALEAEETLRKMHKAFNEENGPTFMGEPLSVAQPKETLVCRTCKGTGVDGDCGPDGQAISIPCYCTTAPQPQPASKPGLSDHDQGIINDLRALAVTQHSGFWPQAIAIGAVRIIDGLLQQSGAGERDRDAARYRLLAKKNADADDKLCIYELGGKSIEDLSAYLDAIQSQEKGGT